MKICIISPYPPKQGGLSTYSKRNVDNLSKKEGVEVVAIPFNSFKDISNVITLGKLKPDVVRLEYNIPAYGLASIPIYITILAYGLLTKIRFVVNYHEVKRETDLLGNLGKLYFRLFSFPFYHIYVHTNEAKKILEFQCHINSRKIYVVPLGTYNFKDTTDYGSELKEKYHLSNRKTILYFGYIHPDKGIEYLLNAIKYLKDSEPLLLSNIQFVIAGDIRRRSGVFKYFEKKDVAYKNYLENLTNNNDISDCVKFIGFIEDKYIYSMLNLAFAIVMPYIKVEQSGVLNMALRQNKPIIATKIGGLKETLKDVGILVRPKDPIRIAKEIKKLAQKEKYYKKISAGYYNLATQLDISRITTSFLKSLSDI